MEKCKQCQSDSIARAETSISVFASSQGDIEYFMKANAYCCRDCGYIHLTSKKVDHE